MNPIPATLRRLHFALWALWLALPGLEAGSEDGRLEIHWIDVEGGAATLIVTPAGESVLVDSGNPGTRDAERIHRLATATAKLSRIDYLITTHFHLDHFGGAAQLARLMPVDRVYDNGIPERNPDNRPGDTRFPLLVRPYRDMEVNQRLVINPGDRIPLKQAPETAALELVCLGTRRQFVAATADTPRPALCASLPALRERDQSDNANSVVLLLKFGDFRFFDAGDLTWNVESRLVCPQNLVGSTVDVYQVTHHGLDSSNHPTLVNILAPTVTIMNNGVTKGCQPKTFATLAALTSAQAHYQMHKNLRSDQENNVPDEYIANLKKDCDAHPIHLKVDPDGRRYTVQVPSRDHSRVFQTTAKR